MEFSSSLRDKITAKYSMRQLKDSQEILDKARSIDETSLDYWEDFPHTQGMLDIGNFTCYILEQEDVPKGLVVTGLEEEGRLWIEIWSMALDARQQGIAEMLRGIAIEIGKAHQARIVLIDCDTEEEKFLFKNLNFKSMGTLSNIYPDGSGTEIFGLHISK